MNIKKAIQIGLVAALSYLPLSANANSELEQKAKTPKTSVTLTEIAADGEKPLTRAEVLALDLPLNTDLYISREDKGDFNFYKMRAQVAPFKYSFLEAGIAGQHVDSSNFDSFQEAGPLLRVKAKPTKNSFVKLDTRYFPEKEALDGYWFAKFKDVTADCLWRYDLDDDTGFFRPGLDYNLTKNLVIGLEGRVEGPIDGLEKKYAGVRARIRF